MIALLLLCSIAYAVEEGEISVYENRNSQGASDSYLHQTGSHSAEFVRFRPNATINLTTIEVYSFGRSAAGYVNFSICTESNDQPDWDDCTLLNSTMQAEEIGHIGSWAWCKHNISYWQTESMQLDADTNYTLVWEVVSNLGDGCYGTARATSGNNKHAYLNTGRAGGWTSDGAGVIQVWGMEIITQTIFLATDLYPANNTQYNYSSINFNSTGNNFTNTANCSLMINGTYYSSANYTGTDQNISITSSVADGSWSFYFNCTDSEESRNTTSNLFFVDTSDPSAAWNAPASDNSTIQSSPLTINATISDENLYSYYLLVDYSNGTNYINQSNTSLTGLDTYDVINTSAYPVDDTYTAWLQVCDGHTSSRIDFNADIVDDELLFDNGQIKIYLKTKSETSKISYDLKHDRYTYSFDTKTPTDNLVYVVESTGYIDILDGKTDYEGHLVSHDKWIDFEGAEVQTANVNRVSDTEVEVWVYFKNPGTSFSFESIGELNCIESEVEFEIDSTGPVVTNLLPLNDSQDTDGEVVFTFSVSEYSNCTLYLNGAPSNESSVEGTGNLEIPYTFTEAVNVTWFAVCYDNASNNGNSSAFSLEVTLTDTILQYGYFDTNATCILDQELAYVIGYFAIIALILVLYFANLFLLKVPVISFILGIAEIIVTLNFYACTWVVGAIFTLFGLIMIFYEIVLLKRHLDSFNAA